LSFWWKAKSSSYEFAFEDFIFVVGSAANSVGTMLEFTAFGSGPNTNLAELVPSVVFFVHNHGFSGGPNTFSQKKHPCLSLHSNLRNSRNIESSRSTSLEFAAFGNGMEVKQSRVKQK